MGNYTVDDGESIYTVNLNIPNIKKKYLRRHNKVMNHIRKTWKEIKDIMLFYISNGIGTNDLMSKYVRLFINQSRNINHKIITKQKRIKN